jgi:hypothetical protein
MGMNDTPGARTFFTVAGGIGLLWQAILIALAFQHADALRVILHDAGIQPAIVTRLFFATYKWWPIVLALSGAAVFVPLRRATMSPTELAMVAAIPLFVAMLLQTWLNEAATAPLYQIIQRIG